MYFKKFINNKITIHPQKKFALIIGETPSLGARSPTLWNKAYLSIKKKIKMYPADVDHKNLNNLIFSLKKNKNYIGGSVTTPYKIAVMKYLDEIDKNSKKIGSINTILRKKNKLVGLNTDYLGSLDSFKKIKLNKKEKNILILGCGGAGKACILAALKNYKRKKFYFFNRSKHRLKNFINKIKIKNYKIIENYKDLNKLSKINLIINTTSVGFDSWIKIQNKYYNLKLFSPLGDLKKIKGCKKKIISEFYNSNSLIHKNNLVTTFNFYIKNPKAKVFDMIYNPKETCLIKVCSFFDNCWLNGLNMNLIQAVKAFMIVNNFNNYKKIYKSMVSNG